MISCEKAAKICNKTQYKEASFLEKISLRIHLLICKNCPQFAKKNTAFTSLCEKAKLRSLSESEKIEMKQKLEDISK
tara:strand:+ start:3967 stop:4197 length:231 start_codon:yes stop_codon:yes gene_type:complete